MLENRHQWLIQLFDTGEQLNHNDAALQDKQQWLQQLIKENALSHSGNVTHVLCQQCDFPHDILIDPVTFTGYCADSGNITIPPEILKNYQASVQWIIDSSRKSLGVTASDKTRELVAGHLWKIGSVRLGGKPRPLFLCRDIGQSIKAVTDSLKKPHEDTGVILLTSPHQICPDVLMGHRVAALSICLSETGKNFISHEILERIWKGQPTENGSLTFTPDFSSVTLNGETHHFQGTQQRAFVKRLIELHTQGQTPVRTREIMSAIEVYHTRRISNLFSKHKTWKRLINYGTPRGYCRIRVN